MPKPIKFRIWDKSEDMMLYQGQYAPYFGCDGYFIGVGNGTLIFEDRCPESKSMEAEEYDDDDYAVMQFTGLLDKNGVEIYEGDILEGKEPKDYGVVVYMQPQFVVDPVSDHKINTLGEGQVGFEKLRLSQVVGNIYENPDLLLGNKQ